MPSKPPSKAPLLVRDLKGYVDPAKRDFYPRFFKTGVGEYGEGDKFLGVTVVSIKKVIRSYSDLSLDEIKELLYDDYHEIRLASLYLLVSKYERSLKLRLKNKKTKKPALEQEIDDRAIVDFYLENLEQVNNWDLVDASAHKILGDYLLRNQAELNILKSLAREKDLWKNRVSVMATFPFIKNGHFDEILFLAKHFLKHQHDLIHKVVGWMLREMGKRDKEKLLDFIEQNKREMPRVMLRYAIEKLPAQERKNILQK